MSPVVNVIVFLILLLTVASHAIADNDFVETDNGARYWDIVTCTGAAAETGDVATMHFTGRLTTVRRVVNSTSHMWETGRFPVLSARTGSCAAGMKASPL